MGELRFLSILFLLDARKQVGCFVGRIGRQSKIGRNFLALMYFFAVAAPAAVFASCPSSSSERCCCSKKLPVPGLQQQRAHTHFLREEDFSTTAEAGAVLFTPKLSQATHLSPLLSAIRSDTYY